MDYPAASAALARILGEMIGPQSHVIREDMKRQFLLHLDREIAMNDLRVSVATHKTVPPLPQ